MSKRTAEEMDGGGGGSSGSSAQQPTVKKVQLEPFMEPFGPVYTLEEMDIKILKHQNKKLAQRIEQRLRIEDELKKRIEQLEKRQMQDDAVLNVVNRYWNQLNEDLRIMLQRFDAETADEMENKNENEVTTSFLMQLSSWDKEELDDKLANRVQVSTRAVSKIIQVFDRLMQRNQKVSDMLKTKPSEKDGEPTSIVSSIEETLRNQTVELMEENEKLQARNIQLHEQHHIISLKMLKFQDAMAGKETEAAELRKKVDDLNYDMEKLRCLNDKLQNYLSEVIEKWQNSQIQGTTAIDNGKSGGMTNYTHTQQLAEMKKELEAHRELATNRLQELDKLHKQHLEDVKEVEKLKNDIRQLPETIIVETTEYKCLQSQYSVLYNDYMKIRNQLEETRNQLQNSKNHHLRQIELMESKELNEQKRIREDMIKLEDKLETTQKEYLMLRMEYEQNTVANEQTAPINREMRQLITSLQEHNIQLKEEVGRYKRKYKEVSSDNVKWRKNVEEMQAKLNSQQVKIDSKNEIKTEENTIKEEEMQDGSFGGVKEEGVLGIKLDSEDPETDPDKAIKGEKKEGDKEEASSAALATVKHEKDDKNLKFVENDVLKDLKTELRNSLTEQRTLKVLLDMYKSAPKETRDKVQLMATERKLRTEIEELKNQMKKMQESKREDRKKLADEEAQRKIKQLTEQLELAKQANVNKPLDGSSYGCQTFIGSNEEQALLKEIDVTGKAFEEMQEQNSRLLQQLKEKDDANFKLMSDRIKANQLNMLFKEERQVLQEQVRSQHAELEAMHDVLKKLGEKERILQISVTRLEASVELQRQTMDLHKRKAIEQAQSAADLNMYLEKYRSQMTEAEQVHAERTTSLEAEAYKNKRLQEDLLQFKRKYERMKNMEMSSNTSDEIAMAEIKEYKEILTCPSCKINKKDAVLSKCFHVFCYDCLKTRYETRQRKCPKCNCAFGANDYHRLWLT